MKIKRDANNERPCFQKAEWNVQTALLKARAPLHELKISGGEAWEDL